MVAVIAVSLLALLLLLHAMWRSIRDERTERRSVWREFGLTLALLSLFLSTWLAHGLSEWQVYTDEARSHGEEPEAGDFVSQFASSTLENWQSEFLQLFSFTIMAAVLIHKGSAESKDSDDRIEEALQRLEKKLDTEPTSHEGAADQDLHVLPDEHQGWQLRSGDSTEPEGYYDTQDEAIQAGRPLANAKNVTLHIHTPEGHLRESVGGS